MNNRVIVNDIKDTKDMPIVSLEAKQLSQSLKKKGFKYVGPTICYAYMQVIGFKSDKFTVLVNIKIRIDNL